MELRSCVVRLKRGWIIGLLFMENERVVVILNDIRSAADLGPLKPIRREHIDPEANVWVLPRDQVEEIQILEKVPSK